MSINPISYNNEVPGPNFMRKTPRTSHHELLSQKEFFSGSCFECGAMASDSNICLKRCAGCQLISYCGKICQKTDWIQHRILCKAFPVVKGKNVIVQNAESIPPCKGNQMILSHSIGQLHWKAMMAYNDADPQDGLKMFMFGTNGVTGLEKIFQMPRVCQLCPEARPEKLFDCRCCAVSYCSNAHRMQDKNHLANECDNLYRCAMVNWYLRKHQHLRIPDGILNEANLNDGLKYEKVSRLSKYSDERWLKTIVDILNERLAFPLTIYYALKGLKIGKEKKEISEITRLNIHIVNVTPMLDPSVWEFFIHQFPNLKKLNLTFISGIMRFFNRFNAFLPSERCSDCKENQRVITYNIQPMHYHNYFSSSDYVEPDVVAVFGVDIEFAHTRVDVADNFKSQKKMTQSKHTVVILTDIKDEYAYATSLEEMKSDENLDDYVKVFSRARPVKVLLPIQDNPVCGFSTWRGPYFTFNILNRVCCIQAK